MPLNLNRAMRNLARRTYGLYVLIVFVVLGLLTFVLVTLIPGLSMNSRRAIAHGIARALFFCVGIRLKIIDAGGLPASPSVVVANHASYLDGLVLKAALPARFSFVIKKEVTQVPLAGLLLRRIGSEFVDRFNRHAGAMDARRLIRAADAGQSLVFFPEGTFIAEPGVGKFHTGAFAIAARANLPIVPVSIRGTRDILPSGHTLPSYGAIEVRILSAIVPDPAADDALTVPMTRELARAKILAALGEPDLAATAAVVSLQAMRKA